MRRREVPAAARNPFLTVAAAVPAVEVLDRDPLWDDAVVLGGPATPAAAPDVDVSDVQPWPTVQTNDRPTVFVMALHGGAGASTLAGLLGDDAADTGQRWPVAAGWERPLPSLPVVAVARTHHHGLQAADRLARLWAAGELPGSTLLGLVLVDDAPRLLTQQRRTARRLGRMTPRGWHLPWNEVWRIQPPTPETTPIRVRRTVDSIRASARGHRKDAP